MKPRIHVLTLAVEDLERSMAFYRDGLGLATDGIVGTEFEDGAVVFFKMNVNLTLALWPRRSLAKDANVKAAATNPSDFSLGHLVGSKDEVDKVLDRARSAGATITQPGADRFWGGYSGYFLDLDGHLWEVAWNPGWELAEE
ncbi:MAG TPA: VOC family protein [Actinomycetota bacterium]|nr:VOC family protein [Actinomycetota bacterium]